MTIIREVDNIYHKINKEVLILVSHVDKYRKGLKTDS